MKRYMYPIETSKARVNTHTTNAVTFKARPATAFFPFIRCFTATITPTVEHGRVTMGKTTEKLSPTIPSARLDLDFFSYPFTSYRVSAPLNEALTTFDATASLVFPLFEVDISSAPTETSRFVTGGITQPQFTQKRPFDSLSQLGHFTHKPSQISMASQYVDISYALTMISQRSPLCPVTVEKDTGNVSDDFDACVSFVRSIFI